jgi:PleD family two-component response regulator
MIIYQETTGYRPSKRICREFTSASATDRRELLHSAGMMAQAGETAEGKAPVRVSAPRPQGAPNRRGDVPQASVLIVDDEEPVRETLAEALSFHGYRLITAASVGEAEEAMQQLGIVGVEGIHLVIVDIHLTPGRQLRAGYALA